MRYFFLVVVSFFFFQCSLSENCGGELNPNPEIGFYTLDTITAEETALKISTFSMQVLDATITDSIFIDDQEVSSIFIPLNTNADSSQFLLTIGETKDTITLFYERILYSRATDCEFIMNFNLTNSTHTSDTLKKISIENSLIEDLEKTTETDETAIPIYHIKFFF